jgi:hypothetical protein
VVNSRRRPARDPVGTRSVAMVARLRPMRPSGRWAPMAAQVCSADTGCLSFRLNVGPWLAGGDQVQRVSAALTPWRQPRSRAKHGAACGTRQRPIPPPADPRGAREAGAALRRMSRICGLPIWTLDQVKEPCGPLATTGMLCTCWTAGNRSAQQASSVGRRPSRPRDQQGCSSQWLDPRARAITSICARR